MIDGTFKIWKQEVDRLLQKNYAIDTEIAGLDHAQLIFHFRSCPSPNEFVDWYAEKYDLVKLSLARFLLCTSL